MKRGYLLLSILGVALLLVGCSYSRFKDRALKYLKDKGYTCSSSTKSFSDGTKEDMVTCDKEENGINKVVHVFYENDFYTIYEVTKEDVTITIKEDNFTKGYGIPFYKGDTSYGLVYKYVKGSIDSDTNKSYEYGAELIDECREDLVIDNPTNKAKCDEVRKYLDLVNNSIKELKELYNENDIPISIELQKEY